MLNHGWRTLTALAAGVVLTVGVGTASASSGFSIAEAFRIEARSAAITFGPLESPIVCEVIRRISLHGSIRKVEGALIGFVTEATARNCRGGAVRMLSETLPWHIVYDGFTGSLPNIATARVIIREIAWLEEYNNGLSRCLWVGEVPGEAIISRGAFTELVYAAGRFIGRSLNILPCPETSQLRGNLRMVPQPRVRLM